MCDNAGTTWRGRVLVGGTVGEGLDPIVPDPTSEEQIYRAATIAWEFFH